MSGVTPFTALSEADANAFLSSWFAGCEGHVGFVGIPVGRGGPLGMSVPVETARAGLAADDMMSLVYGADSPMNVYVNVATLTGPITNPKVRGGKETVREVPGVWVDFDVKKGAFESEEAIFEYVRGLDLRPTVGVKSGSGGVHCYWKFESAVMGNVAESVCRSWWAYLQERAGEVGIDRLVDSTRVMKLPGTVRWPKGDGAGDEVSRPVELLYADGPVWPMSRVMALGSEPWRKHQKKIDDTRARVTESRTRTASQIFSSGKIGYRDLQAMADIEEAFNTSITWDDVLLPHGWTWVTGYDGEQRVDGAGRRHWSRPGGDGSKSATTDWVESEDVMSLLSDSEGTGLSDLKEAGIALTKYRVWLRLAWGDDEVGLVRAWIGSQHAVGVEP